MRRWQRDAAHDRESLLSASGFTVLPANTPQRQDMLAKLPPNRVSQLIQGDKVSYLYPDPVLCHCLYAGGQQQFAQYPGLRAAAPHRGRAGHRSTVELRRRVGLGPLGRLRRLALTR